MDTLTVNCEVSGEALVAALVGTLGLSTTSHFDQELTAALVDSGANHVVLDCSRLEFVDSSGLGAMVSLLRRLRESGGRVDLAGVRAGLLELLYITKLEQHFGMFKSVEAALTESEQPAAEPVTDQVSPELRHEPAAAGPPAQDAGATEQATLPAYEGLANYPTWYVANWFLNRPELHQQATEIIKQAAHPSDASRALHRLLLQRCDEALKASTMVSGLFGFALGYVVWPEVIAEIRKYPAKSYNKG